MPSLKSNCKAGFVNLIIFLLEHINLRNKIKNIAKIYLFKV